MARVERTPYLRCKTTEAFHRLVTNEIKGLMGPIGPLSGDTEFLSPTGWIRIDQWKPGQTALTINALDGMTAQWEDDVGLVKRESKGFIRLADTQLDMMMSPDHGVIHGFNGRPGLRVSTAGVATKIKSATWPTTFNGIAGPDLFEERHLRLLVAIAADGHFPVERRQGTVVVNLTNARKLERLRSLLLQCNIEFTEKVFPSRPLETVVTFISPLVKTKKLSDFLGKYSSNDLAVIVDECAHWDGSIDRNECKRYYTNDKVEADFMQIALSACGYESKPRINNPPTDTAKTCYVLAWGRKRKNNGHVIGRDHRVLQNVPSEDGFEYCLTTKAGWFLARRKDGIFITKNTGKTISCLYDCVFFCHRVVPKLANGEVRKARVLIIRQNQTQIKSSVLASMKSWFGEAADIRMDYPIKFMTTFNIDGSLIDIEWTLTGYEGPQDEGRLRSSEYTCGFINEIQFYADPKAVVEAVYDRLGRFPLALKDSDGNYLCNEKGDPIGYTGQRQVVFDANYPHDTHPLYHLNKVETPPGWKIFNYPEALLEIKDADGKVIDFTPNPDADYVKKQQAGSDYWVKPARMAFGANPDKVYVEYFGRYGSVKSGKPVYSMWSDSIHLIPGEVPINKNKTLLIGYDHTGLNQAMAMMQTGMEAHQIIDELYVPDCGFTDFIEGVFIPWVEQKGVNRDKILLFLDPQIGRGHDAMTVVLKLKKHGFTCKSAHSNDWKVRKNTVADLLSRRLLRVSSKAKLIAEGFRGAYEFEKVRGQSNLFKVQPSKTSAHSHIQEAVSYVAMGVVYGAGKETLAERSANGNAELSYSGASFTGIF